MAANDTLADRLLLDFLSGNAAARAVAPESIFTAETPIVVRYTFIGAIAIYDARAACHPTALSFFGTRDRAPSALCTRDANAILVSLTTLRALSLEFSAEAAVYETFLRSENINPDPSSRNRNTVNGLANFFGDRIANRFARDGWNSLGDADIELPSIPFQDFTQYQPVNAAGLSPRNLPRPLRWQPMTQSAPNGNGRFVSQVHVLPHIGVTGRPVVLGARDFRQRRANGTFHAPNAKRHIQRRDARVARSLLREVLAASASLTGEQRFMAKWWENKLTSTSAISSYYEGAAGLDEFQVAQQFAGEMAAQYDAILVVWREKRRFDQARPRTVLLNLKRKERFRAFISEDVGFGRVRAEEWQPVVMEQAHSEFPSASATICMAAMEHIQLYVENKLGTSKIPSIKIRVTSESLPFLRNGESRTVSFNGPLEAAETCGVSRLWAGVHFRPAIDQGFVLGRGVGRAAFEHMKALGEGKVPRNCAWCLKGVRRGGAGSNDVEDVGIVENEGKGEDR